MTSAPGHETSPDGPITVINIFEVPAGQVRALREDPQLRFSAYPAVYEIAAILTA